MGGLGGLHDAVEPGGGHALVVGLDGLAQGRQEAVHPATQRNLRQLAADGTTVLGPASGDQACGEIGDGRMLEPEELLEDVIAFFQPKVLLGQRVLITAGPTQEPLDPVRYISNRSSGKMGYALAEAAVARGGHVILISGPVHLSAPRGAETIGVRRRDISSMLTAMASAWPRCSAPKPG